MVDVESDGPSPGNYSMISFGAVLVTPALDQTFYGKLRPISDQWIPEALAVSGFSRDEVVKFDAPEKVMANFRDWLKANVSGRPMFHNGVGVFFRCGVFVKRLALQQTLRVVIPNFESAAVAVFGPADFGQTALLQDKFREPVRGDGVLNLHAPSKNVKDFGPKPTFVMQPSC